MKLNQLYLSAIKEAYPNIQISDIKVFDDGWDYVVYVVSNSIAYRFPRRADYAKTLPNEIAFLKLFSSISPIQIPNLTFHNLNNGQPFATYPFIKGTQFSKNVAESLTETQLLDIAGQLGRFLTVLHSFPLEKARRIGIKEGNAPAYWTDKYAGIRKLIFPHISKTEKVWISNLFLKFIEIINNRFEKRLCHCDIMPEHIIVDPITKTLNGIIDFGDIEISDPAYDFFYLRKYGNIFLKKAYSEYKLSRDKFFEQRRQFYEDRLVVTNLEHSIKSKDDKRIQIHKQQLNEYILNCKSL